MFFPKNYLRLTLFTFLALLSIPNTLSKEVKEENYYMQEEVLQEAPAKELSSTLSSEMKVIGMKRLNDLLSEANPLSFVIRYVITFPLTLLIISLIENTKNGNDIKLKLNHKQLICQALFLYIIHIIHSLFYISFLKDALAYFAFSDTLYTISMTSLIGMTILPNPGISIIIILIATIIISYMTTPKEYSKKAFITMNALLITLTWALVVSLLWYCMNSNLVVDKFFQILKNQEFFNNKKEFLNKSLLRFGNLGILMIWDHIKDIVGIQTNNVQNFIPLSELVNPLKEQKYYKLLIEKLNLLPEAVKKTLYSIMHNIIARMSYKLFL